MDFSFQSILSHSIKNEEEKVADTLLSYGCNTFAISIIKKSDIMKIKSYLSFNGNAEEALNFYAGVFNGTIGEIYRYGKYTEMESPAEYKDKIIHSCLSFNGCTISLADTMPGTKSDFGSLGHMITVFCDNQQQLKEIYQKLSVGGQIKCELCQPDYAELYAEVIDHFGVLWALIIEEGE